MGMLPTAGQPVPSVAIYQLILKVYSRTRGAELEIEYYAVAESDSDAIGVVTETFQLQAMGDSRWEVRRMGTHAVCANIRRLDTVALPPLEES